MCLLLAVWNATLHVQDITGKMCDVHGHGLSFLIFFLFTMTTHYYSCFTVCILDTAAVRANLSHHHVLAFLLVYVHYNEQRHYQHRQCGVATG